MANRDELERQLDQCRRLARSLTDKPAVERLVDFADELESRLKTLDAQEDAND